MAATAADFDVARIDGTWLITNFVGGTTELYARVRAHAPATSKSHRRPKATSLSRIDDPFVRAIARLPVKVRTKLLIAFVGTSLLLVAVGLLGQLVLGS